MPRVTTPTVSVCRPSSDGVLTCSTTNRGRRPPPQMNPFRQFVTTELQRRKRNLSMIGTPFVRMVSCLATQAEVVSSGGACSNVTTTVSPYTYFTLGFHGYTGGGNLFDITYGNREIVGYAYRNGHQTPIDTSQLPSTPFLGLLEETGVLSEQQAWELEVSSANMRTMQSRAKTPAGGAHPMPGITNVTIQRFTDGAGIKAIVSWKCYNRQQLEFLRHHFMLAGSHIVLEWGHEFVNKRPVKFLDYSKSEITDIIAQSIIKGRKYTIENYVCPNEGNYDFLAGAISNFTVQLDAATNIYNCTTEIVTSGEYLWGLSVPQTFTNSDNTTDTTVTETTIESYFKEGNNFDVIIDTPANQGGGKIASPIQEPLSGHAPDNIDTDAISKNPHDYKFISWKFFMGDVLKNLFEIFETSPTDVNGARHELVSKQMSAFLKLSESDVTDYPETIDNPWPWIGNNRYLRSTNPENMILIQSDMQNVPAEFGSGGMFDTGSGEGKDRGLLNNGVWLNIGMVRRCFLEATTFEQAIRSIIFALNDSCIGYWALQLLYDEETASYKIIDNKYCSLREIVPAGQKIYKFNVNTVGECLDISLDSAYPPEVVTQLALVARLKDNPTQFMTNIQKYPSFGVSSHWAMAMNWTNYTDLVYEAVKHIHEDNTRSAAGITERPYNAALDNMGPSTPRTNRGTANPAATDPNVSNIGRLTGQTTAPSTRGTPAGTPPGAPPTPATSTASPVGNPVNTSGVVPVTTPSSTDITRGLGGRVTTANGVVVTPPVRAALQMAKALAEGRGVSFRVNSGYRSQASQDRLRANYDIVAASPGGPAILRAANQYRPALISPHLKGLAIDVTANQGTSEAALVALLTDPRVGFTWQGVGDPVHFNYHGPGSNWSVVDAGVTYAGQLTSLTTDFPVTTNGEFQSGLIGRRGGSGVAGIRGASGAAGAPVVLSAEAQAALDATIADITYKFGDGLLVLIEPNTTRLRNTILKDGFANHANDVSNGFIAPVPTTAKVNIKFQGISGISIFDIFSVDKLPYIYDQFGIFHVIQINDTISPQGWTTELYGIFRFLYFDPEKSQLQLLSKMVY